MNRHYKFSPIFTVVFAVALSLACGKSQVEDANKIVTLTNKKIDVAKVLYAKTEARNTSLFSANVQTPQQLQYYKSRMSSEAQAIVGDYEKVSVMLKEISRQYDEVSRMNIGDKFKNYAKIKADEFAKRAEAIEVRKSNAQAFMEIDDPDTMTAKLDENNAKSDRLFKDAEDMNAQAKKMEEDNKEIFTKA